MLDHASKQFLLSSRSVDENDAPLAELEVGFMQSILD